MVSFLLWNYKDHSNCFVKFLASVICRSLINNTSIQNHCHPTEDSTMICRTHIKAWCHFIGRHHTQVLMSSHLMPSMGVYEQRCIWFSVWHSAATCRGLWSLLSATSVALPVKPCFHLLEHFWRVANHQLHSACNRWHHTSATMLYYEAANYIDWPFLLTHLNSFAIKIMCWRLPGV